MKYELHSPLTPHQKTLNTSILVNPLETDQSHLHPKPDKILDLYSKFVTINNEVTIDHDLSAFNMIEYNNRQLKMDFDQQLIVAKLKRLENNAELKRINMELEQRKKKVHRHKEKDFQALPENQKYMDTYREFTEQGSRLLLDPQMHTDSEDETRGVQTERPMGVTFFNQLKKHPKVLEYTVEQIRSKELMKKEMASDRKLKYLQFRNQVKNMGHITSMKMRKQKKKTNQTQANPERLAQNIFRKLYTKRNKQKSIQEVKRDKRLSHFVNKQQMIVDNIDQRSLSKQLYKKLKERLNNIATQLYMDQKKHTIQTALPKVRLNKTLLL